MLCNADVKQHVHALPVHGRAEPSRAVPCRAVPCRMSPPENDFPGAQLVESEPNRASVRHVWVKSPELCDTRS